MAIWSILRPFGIFVAILVNIFHGHLVHFSSFGILYQEQSGNPGSGFSYPVLKSSSRTEHPSYKLTVDVTLDPEQPSN
jgi:hypothetical protein